jgi:acrylyl-CoA reductase (NADPH)
MQVVMEFEKNGVVPENGEILVTGASGGVGSIIIALLATLGYRVTAVTGKKESHSYLKTLGASNIIDRSEYLGSPSQPLMEEKWAGIVDCVGAAMLPHLLAQLRYGGIATTIGGISGIDVSLSLLPFVLRGISLIGINSVYCPKPIRKKIWQRITSLLSSNIIKKMSCESSMEEVTSLGKDILNGKIRGRIVIKIKE